MLGDRRGMLAAAGVPGAKIRAAAVLVTGEENARACWVLIGAPGRQTRKLRMLCRPGFPAHLILILDLAAMAAKKAPLVPPARCTQRRQHLRPAQRRTSRGHARCVPDRTEISGESRLLTGTSQQAACDPRAIASGRPRSRTGSHGHSAVASTEAPSRHLRWSEHWKLVQNWWSGTGSNCRPSAFQAGRRLPLNQARILLPILLPSRRTTPVPGGQLWNVGPAHGPHRTVLDDVPTPTDKKVSWPPTRSAVYQT